MALDLQYLLQMSSWFQAEEAMRELRNFSSWADRQRQLVFAFKQIEENGDLPPDLAKYLEEVRRSGSAARKIFPASDDDMGTNE